VIVAAIDSCRLDRLDHWERIARDAEMNLISIQVHGGEVVIGPEVRPKRARLPALLGDTLLSPDEG